MTCDISVSGPSSMTSFVDRLSFTSTLRSSSEPQQLARSSNRTGATGQRPAQAASTANSSQASTYVRGILHFALQPAVLRYSAHGNIALHVEADDNTGTAQASMEGCVDSSAYRIAGHSRPELIGPHGHLDGSCSLGGHLYISQEYTEADHHMSVHCMNTGSSSSSSTFPGAQVSYLWTSTKFWFRGF